MDRDRKRGLIQVTSHKLSVQVAINSWRLVVERANKIFSSLTEDQLLKEVAPGRTVSSIYGDTSLPVTTPCSRFSV